MIEPYIRGIKKNKTILALILILFFAAWIRCYEITLPYCKIYEAAIQENIARNHVVYGFGQTHFLSVYSVVNGENIYHLSHQPLLQILIAISYMVFGIHEWSARLVPIFFSLGSIILVYAIADRVWHRRTALFAALFAAFIPMSAYFGRIVNFEPLVLFFVLLLSWAYLVWSDTNNNKYYILAIAAVLLGGLTDWPFFLVLPFFLLISLITRKKILETGILFLLGCGIAVGYLVIKSSLVGYQSGVSGWFSHVLYRSSIPSFIGNPELYTRILLRLWSNFSISIILAAIGVIIFLNVFREKQYAFRRPAVKDLIPLALLLFGSSYIAIFLQSTYVHYWQMYFLIAGVSLYAAYAMSCLFSVALQNRTWTLLLRLVGILIVIMFLVFSVQGTMALHKTKSYDNYYLGSWMDEIIEPGDYICTDFQQHRLAYYSNSSDIQIPSGRINSSLIRTLKPKFVIFSSDTSLDSSWSKDEIIQELNKEHYHLLTITPPSNQIWIRDTVFVPFILWRNSISIEVHEPLMGNTIPNKTLQGLVRSGYNTDGQPALFEHPVSKGVIRTNYLLDIPQGSALSFGIGLDERTWNPLKGDGVQFEIYCQSGGNETCLFSQYIDPKNNPADRKWHYYSIPFDTCWGSNTTISFATLSGPKNNNAYDWAYWINPRIEVKQVI